jgi:hypothetical protein
MLTRCVESKNHLLQVSQFNSYDTIGKTLRKYQHDKGDGKMIDRVRNMGENGMDDGGNSNDKQGDGIHQTME